MDRATRPSSGQPGARVDEAQSANLPRRSPRVRHCTCRLIHRTGNGRSKARLSWTEPDFQRATLEMKCAGLSDEQLRERAVPPSTLSLLGLVRHLSDVERIWFVVRFARREVPAYYSTDTNLGGDFNDLDPPVDEFSLGGGRPAPNLAKSLPDVDA
jgi:hypothetical protein